MIAEGLAPSSVNTYLSLLGTVLNAVEDDCLPAPRRWCASAVPAALPPTRNQPVPRRQV
jgi:hypothetical protein